MQMSKKNIRPDLKIIIKRLINFMGDRKKLINAWITWFKTWLIIWYTLCYVKILNILSYCSLSITFLVIKSNDIGS